MEDLVEDVSRESALAPDAVRRALAILMGYLLDTVGDGTRQRLAEVHPELVRLGTPERQKKGLFSGLLGSNAALLALPGKLAKAGVPEAKWKKAGPSVLAWLRANTPRDLWDEVEGQLPGFLRKKS